MPKTTAESLPVLSTAYLLKYGFLRNGGGCVCGKVVWPSRWGDDVTASVTVWLGVSPRLTMDGHEVAMTSTRPFYGGRRWWFHCPNCSRRVAALYLGRVPACRKCFALCYRSQLAAHGRGKAGDLVRDINLAFPWPKHDPEKIRYKRWKGRPTKRVIRLAERERRLIRRIFKAKHP